MEPQAAALAYQYEWDKVLRLKTNWDSVSFQGIVLGHGGKSIPNCEEIVKNPLSDACIGNCSVPKYFCLKRLSCPPSAAPGTQRAGYFAGPLTAVRRSSHSLMPWMNSGLKMQSYEHHRFACSFHRVMDGNPFRVERLRFRCVSGDGQAGKEPPRHAGESDEPFRRPHLGREQPNVKGRRLAPPWDAPGDCAVSELPASSPAKTLPQDFRAGVRGSKNWRLTAISIRLYGYCIRCADAA
jgi:hypothetical protein